MSYSKLNQFKKHEINTSNQTVGGGINTTYNDGNGGSTGGSYQDTWYLFKKNNESTITMEGEPNGHTDFTNTPVQP